MKMTTTTGSGGGTVEDEAFAKIKMGVNVDIKRSDGKKERQSKRREFYCHPSSRPAMYLRRNNPLEWTRSARSNAEVANTVQRRPGRNWMRIENILEISRVFFPAEPLAASMTHPGPATVVAPVPSKCQRPLQDLHFLYSSQVVRRVDHDTLYQCNVPAAVPHCSNIARDGGLFAQQGMRHCDVAVALTATRVPTPVYHICQMPQPETRECLHKELESSLEHVSTG